MREARVFAPGHLTGLFQICDQASDPINKGARGAGISITRGTTTLVRVTPAEKTVFSIQINREIVEDAFVSEKVVRSYLPRLTEDQQIEVEHIIETPMTAGFGSSGGGALSLSLALNKALETGLNRVEAAQIAHVAEIECGTGLGSVFAADKGGFGVLYKAGAPGVGESKSYEGSSELQVIYLYYGPIPTKEALKNQELRRRINELGGAYVDELYRDLNPTRFLKYSRQFTEHLGLVTPKIRKVFNYMDPKATIFTMAMFGEVAFTVQQKELIGDLIDTLLEGNLGVKPVVTDIDTLGTVFI
jgi:pantoate kinase